MIVILSVNEVIQRIRVIVLDQRQANSEPTWKLGGCFTDIGLTGTKVGFNIQLIAFGIDTKRTEDMLF